MYLVKDGVVIDIVESGEVSFMEKCATKTSKGFKV
jgi:hypothetical protein